MPLIAQPDHPPAGAVLARLHQIHSAKGYLPEADIRAAADDLAIPLSRLYSAAAFYSAFSFQPKGRYTIQVCLGTACYIRGGDRLLEKIETLLGVKAGETTPDGMFTVETVHCLGSCSMSPVIRVGEETYGRLKVNLVGRLFKKYRPGEPGQKGVEEQGT
ncbi:MAG: NAD(P)H-dependent oxidoreductase subunit E [Deltaproteobacteria bacterium]|nr:NAD(P)H-dependent oxidoreductase subunit E [Deltaproteobacteria bacterium]